MNAKLPYHQWTVRHTPEQAALIVEGANLVVSQITFLQREGCEFITGFPLFDSLEFDEKLVALHELCLRVSPKHGPVQREAWCDMSLYVVLDLIEESVHEVFASGDDGKGDSDGIRRWAKLLFDAYSSRESSYEDACSIPAKERSPVERLIVRSKTQPVRMLRLSEESLTDILTVFKDEFFHDYDFLNVNELLDLSPKSFSGITELAGITRDYAMSTNPSCSRQAIRRALEFFGLLDRD